MCVFEKKGKRIKKGAECVRFQKKSVTLQAQLKPKTTE